MNLLTNSNRELPSEQILYIASFCSLKSLDAFSITNKYIRKSCGILKLNELYLLALKSFKNLQNDFVFKCNNNIPDNLKNVYLVTLKNQKPLIKENVFLQFDRHASKKFDAMVGFVVEKNEYFYLEDTTDIISNLKNDQFIAAARLGNSTFKDVEVPENTDFISSFYYRNINPDTAKLVRTTTYPIKEIRCIFDQKMGISNDEIQLIETAAKNAFKPQSYFSSSSNIF
jgi:hypothetical protein